MIRAGLVLLFLALLSKQALARSYGLNEAIELAKRQSFERAAILAQTEALKAKSTQALALSQPTFAFGIGDLAGRPGSENSSLRTYQVSQAFGFPGKAKASANAFENEAKGAEEGLRAKDLEITRQVRGVFLDLWLVQQKLALNAAKQSTFENILAVAKRRLVKSTTTEVEFLALEAERTRIENERADLAAEEKRSRAALNLLLGNPPEADATAATPSLPGATALDAGNLRSRFRSGNPALRALYWKSAAAASRVSEAKSAYLPDLRFSIGTNSYNAYAGSLEVSVPLWFLWNERSGVKAAVSAKAADEAEAAAKERALSALFEEKLIALENVGIKIKNYQATLVPNSKRAFEIAFKNYRFGKIEFATLTSSAESVTNAELELDTLRAGLEKTRAEVEEMAGGAL